MSWFSRAADADLLADLLDVPGRHITTEDESYMMLFDMTKDEWTAHTAGWEGLGATLIASGGDNDNPWIGPDGRLID